MVKYNIKKFFSNMSKGESIGIAYAVIGEFAVNIYRGYNNIEEILAVARKRILSRFHIIGLSQGDVEFAFRVGNEWFNTRLRLRDNSVYYRLKVLWEVGVVDNIIIDNIILFKVKGRRNLYYMGSIIEVMKVLSAEMGVNTFMVFSLEEDVLRSVYIYRFIEENGRYWLKDLRGNIEMEVEVK